MSLFSQHKWECHSSLNETHFLRSIYCNTVVNVALCSYCHFPSNIDYKTLHLLCSSQIKLWKMSYILWLLVTAWTMPAPKHFKHGSGTHSTRLLLRNTVLRNNQGLCRVCVWSESVFTSKLSALTETICCSSSFHTAIISICSPDSPERRSAAKYDER